MIFDSTKVDWMMFSAAVVTDENLQSIALRILQPYGIGVPGFASPLLIETDVTSSSYFATVSGSNR